MGRQKPPNYSKTRAKLKPDSNGNTIAPPLHSCFYKSLYGLRTILVGALQLTRTSCRPVRRMAESGRWSTGTMLNAIGHITRLS